MATALRADCGGVKRLQAPSRKQIMAANRAHKIEVDTSTLIHFRRHS